MKSFIIRHLLMPVLLLVAVAPLTPEIDLALSSYFYDAAAGEFPSNSFFDWVTLLGVVPAQVVAVGAGIVFLLSFFCPSWNFWRKYSLLLTLPMAIGAGLITHAILKDHWDRPRPKQLEVFGGDEHFRPFYRANWSWKSDHKSFPCGHCTMGFYFFSIIFLGRRLKSKKCLMAGILASLFLGGALSMARIAQGGHFFSDTFVASIVMWVTTATCDYILFERGKAFDLCRD